MGDIILHLQYDYKLGSNSSIIIVMRWDWTGYFSCVRFSVKEILQSGTKKVAA